MEDVSLEEFLKYAEDRGLRDQFSEEGLKVLYKFMENENYFRFFTLYQMYKWCKCQCEEIQIDTSKPLSECLDTLADLGEIEIMFWGKNCIIIHKRPSW